MKIKVFSVLAGMVVCVLTAAPVGRENPSPMADLLHRYVDAERIAGVVSVLSTDDYTETYDCIGWADRENRVPMTPDTLFAIFSMTKTFTGAAMMCAIDDGKISLEDSVSKYLPEFAEVKMKDAWRWPLLHAAGHGSLLPDAGASWRMEGYAPDLPQDV